MKKNQTVYLVRLRWEYRYDSGARYEEIGGWRTPLVKSFERAFCSREAADRFCRETSPIWANPFERGEYINIYEEDDEIVLWGYVNDDEEEVLTLSLSFLQEWLRGIIGVVPPNEASLPEAPPSMRNKKVWQWQEWWRVEVVPNATNAQKEQIWQILVPSPYEVVETTLEL